MKEVRSATAFLRELRVSVVTIELLPLLKDMCWLSLRNRSPPRTRRYTKEKTFVVLRVLGGPCSFLSIRVKLSNYPRAWNLLR